MNKLPHALSLGISLGILWLLLSGHFTMLLLALGIVSVVLVLYLALRMDVVDHEGQPVHLKFRATINYWAWLLKAIFLSNIDVCRRILSPSLPIRPTRISIEGLQKSDLGLVIFANSITLTPGTVSMSIDDGVIEVHALSREGAVELEAGEMNRRIRFLEEAS